MAEATRASDENILRMLRLRSAGLSTPQVAQRLGVTQGYVRAATNDVRNDDRAFAGPEADGGYW